MFTELKCFPYLGSRCHLFILNFCWKSGQPGGLKLPLTLGPGRGPTIWCIVRSLNLIFTQEAFSCTWTCDLSVTWQQHYRCVKAPPFILNFINKKNHVNCAFQLNNYGSIFKCIHIKTFIFSLFVFAPRGILFFYCWFLGNWQDLLVEAAGHRRSFVEQRMTFIEFDAKVIKS